MMRTMVGSAIGVLLLGVVFIGFGLRGGASSDSTHTGVFPGAAAASPAPMTVAYTPDPASGAVAAGARPTVVACQAGEQALVRQMTMNGESVSRVECVPAAGYVQQGYVAPQGYVAQPVSDVRVLPAQYSPYSRTVQAERPVYRQARTTERVTRSSGRSLQKRLLIIGGSTAAGAGIGGIVGGKKGALIGAALGGGGSTIYEATRK